MRDCHERVRTSIELEVWDSFQRLGPAAYVGKSFNQQSAQSCPRHVICASQPVWASPNDNAIEFRGQIPQAWVLNHFKDSRRTSHLEIRSMTLSFTSVFNSRE